MTLLLGKSNTFISILHFEGCFASTFNKADITLQWRHMCIGICMFKDRKRTTFIYLFKDPACWPFWSGGWTVVAQTGCDSCTQCIYPSIKRCIRTESITLIKQSEVEHIVPSVRNCVGCCTWTDNCTYFSTFSGAINASKSNLKPS